MKFTIQFIISILFISFFSSLSAQTKYTKTEFSIPLKTINSPKDIPADFNPTLYSLEAPIPQGNSAKAYLLNQKIASRAFFKHYQATNSKSNVNSGPEPLVGKTFQPKRYSTSGNPIQITGGLPSDNTMAISNEGIVMVAMNSVVYARNMNTDTAVFPNYQINLKNFVSGIASSNYYDPKLIYDPASDRFILALLKDNDTLKNEIIICFSSSNNPNDPWNIYHLPGNPLLNGRWTDYPALTIVENKLYFTANLIVPDVSWQIGFDGSIIWEMDKEAGFNGEADIHSTLYSDIKFEGQFIRNLHPVQSATGNSNYLTLLSNRNFAIQNDTIFYLQLFDSTLQIKVLKTDISYGVPPNARQFDTDLSIDGDGLQTNDARILGAIQFEDEIQFVGNTLNPETGFCGIYHGTIKNLNETPTITGQIIGDSIKDFGYPNIVSSGNDDCDRETMIGFNFTSYTDFPGIAAIHVSNTKNYSKVKTIKGGYNYVNRLSSGYERWGDYFGMQAKYNEPGTAYVFGFLALADKTNSGFCAQLFSPDSTSLSIDILINNALGYCNNSATASISNGTSPYNYYWNSDIPTSENQLDNLCNGDSIYIQVVDNKGCYSNLNHILTIQPLEEGVYAYPNPASETISTQFHLEKEAIVKAELYDQQGKIIRILLENKAKKGLNEFSFSVEPLAQGCYSIVLISDSKIIEEFKFIKN